MSVETSTLEPEDAINIPISEPVLVEDAPLPTIVAADNLDLVEVDFGHKEYPNDLIPIAKDLTKYDAVDFIVTDN